MVQIKGKYAPSTTNKKDKTTRNEASSRQNTTSKCLRENFFTLAKWEEKNGVHGSFISHYLHKINIERKVWSQHMVTG